MARKHITLVVLCVLAMCGLALGQGSSQAQDYRVFMQPAMDGTGTDMTASDTLQSCIVFTCEGSKIGNADTSISPNSNGVTTTEVGIKIGEDAIIGTGWSAFSTSRTIGGGWYSEQGYIGTNNGQAARAIIGEVANKLSGAPGVLGMEGGAGDIPEVLSMNEPEFESIYNRGYANDDAAAYEFNRHVSKKLVESFGAEGAGGAGFSWSEVNSISGARNAVYAHIAGQGLNDYEAAQESGRFANMIQRFVMAKGGAQPYTSAMNYRISLFRYAFGLLRTNQVDRVNDAMKAAGLEKIP